MFFKLGLAAVTLLVGSSGLPASKKNDLSSFFIHADETAEVSRMFGGTVAEPGSVPYMAVITDGFYYKIQMCGGSVIGRRTILTAAHCVDSVYSFFFGLSRSLRVTVGTDRWNSGGQTYAIEWNVTHPHWLPNIMKNDVGLLITYTDIELSAVVQLIPLSYIMVPGGVPTRVAGWGRISSTQPLSDVLLELYTTTVDSAQCEYEVDRAIIELDSPFSPNTESHIEICTFHSPGHGTCNGDSGSALVRTDSWHQIGVVSWGFPCARGAPDMYARVSAFKDFIESNIV